MRTTAKPVIEAVRTHILDKFSADYYGDDNETPIERLVEQIDYMRYNGQPTYRTALDWVEGGSALVYYHDVNEFIASLDLTDTGKKYDDGQTWKLYCHLVAREMTKLYEGAKK